MGDALCVGTLRNGERFVTLQCQKKSLAFVNGVTFCNGGHFETIVLRFGGSFCNGGNVWQRYFAIWGDILKRFVCDVGGPFVMGGGGDVLQQFICEYADITANIPTHTHTVREPSIMVCI